MCVDRLNADVQDTKKPKQAADLLRAQICSNELLDHLPVFGGEAAVASGAGASSVGLFLRALHAIAAIVRRAVARELPADGARVAVHESSDLSVRELWLLFPQRSERIPLLAGDLVITHDDPFLAEDSDRKSTRLNSSH